MPRIVPTLFGFFLLGALAIAACNRNPGGAPGAGPGGPGGGPPPMPVETVTLSEKPLERTSEYIASLKSRRSSTIQPQVEGFLTRIAVRSGERVGQGTVLFEVDSGPQQAAVATLESTRAQRDAELSYATQELARTKSLYAAGAVSQRELAQAETASRTAEAALRAVDEQIRQQKTELAYYRVTSPTAGTVGDIPVRPGDRVTKTTVLTTVDENDVLEIYVNVPVQQAADLKLGLPIRIEDDRGNVLAKATLVDGRGSFRSDQLVRARIVWRAEPGLSVPLTAVTRINGQYFAYVVEKEGDKTVARQKGVTLGPLTGNDYLVVDGLKPGEQLITAGIQKIRDGAPVMVGGPPAGAPGQQKAS